MTISSTNVGRGIADGNICNKYSKKGNTLVYDPNSRMFNLTVDGKKIKPMKKNGEIILEEEIVEKKPSAPNRIFHKREPKKFPDVLSADEVKLNRKYAKSIDACPFCFKASYIFESHEIRGKGPRAKSNTKIFYDIACFTEGCYLQYGASWCFEMKDIQQLVEKWNRGTMKRILCHK